ncbi:hypothetical protein OED01_02645 [Microbacterium sp. M28]|uniref:hypothetical protein n=1 Tax=Microbacterium sp. M28 TaxID=2962064 RepID=UPI0021F4D516|nr:hypothetical protein [Microbacterium sp. M28]UYO97650.1 hypothetical protein OED01_02645 [Microbacterium sp. M28]
MVEVGGRPGAEALADTSFVACPRDRDALLREIRCDEDSGSPVGGRRHALHETELLELAHLLTTADLSVCNRSMISPADVALPLAIEVST